MTDAAQMLRLFALALCIYREGRGEGLVGKLLIGQVVENRVQSERWPETYIAVITQPLQFSAFNRSDPNVLVWPREDEPVWADCVAAAQFVLSAPTPLTGANHYHSVDVSPDWAVDGTVVAREGQHVFVLI